MLRMVSATEQMLINISYYYSPPFTFLTIKVSQGIEPETPCLWLVPWQVHCDHRINMKQIQYSPQARAHTVVMELCYYRITVSWG